MSASFMAIIIQGLNPAWAVAGGIGEVSQSGVFVAKTEGEGRVVVTVTEGAVVVSSSARVVVTAPPNDPIPPKDL
jgi:uncharacterized protein (AIM24 family)